MTPSRPEALDAIADARKALDEIVYRHSTVGLLAMIGACVAHAVEHGSGSAIQASLIDMAAMVPRLEAAGRGEVGLH